MKKQFVKEVIIVEGKHDLEKLEQCVDAKVIYSNGTHISREFLDLCKRLNENQGILIFTDPDGPGEYIRRTIMNHVGPCKHASLNVIQTKKKQKVGIEHADCEDILEALAQAVVFEKQEDTLSWHEFVDLDLAGKPDSQGRRDFLSESLSIPKSNAKTLYKYLNMMQCTFEQCTKILGDKENENDR